MDLSIEEINSILEFELKGKQYEYISIENIEQKGYVPVGLLSESKKLCLRYKGDGEIQKLHLFLKLLPKSEFLKDLVTKTGAFSKEATLYKKFLIDLKRNFIGNPIPTCYMANEKDKIVFQDLVSIGFKNVHVQECFTIAHCEECIVTLAKLHAETISYEKENNCKLYELLPEIMEQTLFSIDEENSGRKATITGVNAVKAIQSKYLSDYPEELVDQVFNFMNNMGKMMAPSSTNPNIFSHCDLWSNNIMFRYNDGKITECCLVDFQLAAIRPIGYDLLMLIHLTLDQKDLHSNYDYFLKYYYDELSENLAAKNIELSTLLPWNQYISCTKELRALFVTLAPFILHFVAMPNDMLLNIIKDDNEYHKVYLKDRSEHVLKAAAECPEYRIRVINSIIDAFEHFKNLKHA